MMKLSNLGSKKIGIIIKFEKKKNRYKKFSLRSLRKHFGLYQFRILDCFEIYYLKKPLMIYN